MSMFLSTLTRPAPPQQYHTVESWDATPFLSPVPSSASQQYALILLNQPIPDVTVLKRLWERSCTRICADGGANRLYECFSNEEERTRFLPDYIIGDLDSLQPSIRSYYESHKVQIHHHTDQDSTDLTKCLQTLDSLYPPTPSSGAVASLIKSHDIARLFVPHCLPLPLRANKVDFVDNDSDGGEEHDIEKEPPEIEILVWGALGGRFDHVMSAIHSCYLFPARKIWLLGEDSVAVLLKAGTHDISVSTHLQGPTCGLIPIGGTAKCTTSGLKWNLDPSMPLSFGGLISTSNAFDTGVMKQGDIAHVRIETDMVVLWTTELSYK
ncbi:cAMP-dependent protein kinase subunit [Gaertneriomyces sp. JEL0708]|nr:cAMP-dependent protein kinase subunit [Gaertneriomyces sp. JEL0708]